MNNRNKKKKKILSFGAGSHGISYGVRTCYGKERREIGWGQNC